MYDKKIKELEDKVKELTENLHYTNMELERLDAEVANNLEYGEAVREIQYELQKMFPKLILVSVNRNG